MLHLASLLHRRPWCNCFTDLSETLHWTNLLYCLIEDPDSDAWTLSLSFPHRLVCFQKNLSNSLSFHSRSEISTPEMSPKPWAVFSPHLNIFPPYIISFHFSLCLFPPPPMFCTVTFNPRQPRRFLGRTCSVGPVMHSVLLCRIHSILP